MQIPGNNGWYVAGEILENLRRYGILDVFA